MEKKTGYLLFTILLLTLVARLVLAFIIPNFTYDSYYNLRQVEHITKEGIPLYQDELSYGGRTLRILSFFYYFMAFFDLFLPLELAAKIIPNLLIASLTLIIFLISKKITNDDTASLYSALIAGFLPLLFSTNAFMIETLFLPLLFLNIYAFLNINDKKYVYIYIITFLLLCLTSSATIILLMGFGIYLLLLKVEGKKICRDELELIIFSLFFFLWSQSLFFKNLLLQEGISFIWQNVPSNIIMQYFPKMTLVQAIIAVSVIPFLAGIYVVYRSLFQLKNQKIFLLISFVISTTLLTWSRLMEFKHSLTFFGIVLAILFALFYQDSLKFIKKTKLAWLLNFFHIGLIAILAVTLLIPAVNTGLQQNVPVDKEVDAFRWLRQNTPENSGVFALLEEGHLITYYSQRRNVMDNQFALIEDVEKRFSDLNSLFRTNFQTQALSVLDKYNIQYLVLTPQAQRKQQMEQFNFLSEDCFEQIYSQETKIYKVKCNLLETETE